MKVILKEDVKSLGKKGQVVEVSDGYARNFILKKGKGVEATSKNLNCCGLQTFHMWVAAFCASGSVPYSEFAVPFTKSTNFFSVVP